MAQKYFIVGGAGFIGSHLAKALLEEEASAEVVIFDNFSSGKMWHLEEIKGDRRLTVIQGDAKDQETLTRSMKDSDCVYHFASNPDISKALTQPDVDFWEGTYLTNNVLEAMRTSGVKKILYASGSGVYGDAGTRTVSEDFSPMRPISTYGASKLACEALISSYCFMFEIAAVCFRFGNVVGPRQTHGVGYDFVRKLMENPAELEILGDGTQDKPYIYIEDVISAMRLCEKKSKGFECFNVAPPDSLSVTRIADLAKEILGVGTVRVRYAGGSRGWKGDVPVVKLDCSRIKKLGWASRHTSEDAIRMSVKSIYADAQAGRFGWKRKQV